MFKPYDIFKYCLSLSSKNVSDLYTTLDFSYSRTTHRFVYSLMKEGDETKTFLFFPNRVFGETPSG